MAFLFLILLLTFCPFSLFTPQKTFTLSLTAVRCISCPSDFPSVFFDPLIKSLSFHLSVVSLPHFVHIMSELAKVEGCDYEGI